MFIVQESKEVSSTIGAECAEHHRFRSLELLRLLSSASINIWFLQNQRVFLVLTKVWLA